jgi:hypothetical protein
MNDHEAEIINVEEVTTTESYNPNKTSQVVNLININPPAINPELPIDKRSKLSMESFQAMVNFYNETTAKYGFAVEWDFNSLQKTYEMLFDDNNEKLFWILTSKAVSKFTVIWIQKSMESLMTLMEQVNSPEVINNPSYTPEWKVALMNQIFGLMNQAQDFFERVKVDDSEILLKKLAERSGGNDISGLQMDPATQEFMKRLKNISLNIKDKENGADS